MLGRDRAGIARNDCVHDIVDLMPACQKGVFVGADRLRDVEMDVAVAEMAEGKDARAGECRLDRGSCVLDELRNGGDWHRYVVLDRAALMLLHFREMLA